MWPSLSRSAAAVPPLPPPYRRWAACVLPRRTATAAAPRSRTPTCLADASVDCVVESSAFMHTSPASLLAALGMPLLPLALPHHTPCCCCAVLHVTALRARRGAARNPPHRHHPHRRCSAVLPAPARTHRPSAVAELP